MKEIVVVGNTVLDVCASIDATTLTVGHHHIAPVEFRPGGGMPNVARSLTAGGINSIGIGAVGNDPAGVALASLVPQQPHVSNVSTTEMSVILMQPDRTIINNDSDCWIDTSTALEMVPDDSTIALAYANKCCIRPEDLPEFYAASRAKNCEIVAGLNGAFSEVARQIILETSPGARAVVMNEIEALWLADVDPDGTMVEQLDAALYRLSEFEWSSIVTLGKYGAVCILPSAWTAVPTEPIANADTLGAGDAFLAGVVTGISLDLDLAHCAAIGNQVAYHVLTRTPFELLEDARNTVQFEAFNSVAELLDDAQVS